jgi:hypothetical protein
MQLEPTTEPKKRGRKPLPKPELVAAANPLDSEIEGTTLEKLKAYSQQALVLDEEINHNPWRMDFRLRHREVVSRICALINELK